MGRPPSRARRGEGKVYKRGRLWSIRWTENGERRYSGGYLSEDNAKKVLAIVGLNIQAGRPGWSNFVPRRRLSCQPSGHWLTSGSRTAAPRDGAQWMTIDGAGIATSRPCSLTGPRTRRSTPAFSIG